MPSRGSLTLQEPEGTPVGAVSAEPWFMLFIPLTPYCLVPLQGASSVCSPSCSLLVFDTPSQTHGTEIQCMRRSGPCHCQLESRIKSHVGWQMQALREQEEERRRQGFAADTEAPERLFISVPSGGWPQREEEPLVKDQGSFDTFVFPGSCSGRRRRRIRVELFVCSISETKVRPWIPKVFRVYAQGSPL